MKLTVEPVTARLRAPFVSASGSTEARELLLVALEDATGQTGFGEAAPLEAYDGVTVGDCQAAIEDCRPVLADADAADREEVLRQCRQRAVLPQAVAALDLALWDLEGRRRSQPVSRLLAPAPAETVPVNHTVAASDRASAAAAASAARASGYQTIKLKVGLGDDAGRVAAVRAAAGREMAIRLDANGAWSVAEAQAALGALAPAGIELCEEPVRGLEALAEVSELTEVPLAMDESAALPGALDRRRCAAVCLKISRCGGISGTLEAARKAREAGYEVYLASTLDGPLGIAAGLHAAAVLEPDRACGLATLELFAHHEVPLAARQGQIGVPAGPGLGDGLLSWYRR